MIPNGACATREHVIHFQTVFVIFFRQAIPGPTDVLYVFSGSAHNCERA